MPNIFFLLFYEYIDVFLLFFVFTYIVRLEVYMYYVNHVFFLQTPELFCDSSQ